MGSKVDETWGAVDEESATGIGLPARLGSPGPHRLIPAQIGRRALPYLLLAPLFAVTSMFLLYPIGYAVVLSFTSMGIVRPDIAPEFVGLANYRRVLTSPYFVPTVWRTIVYTACLVSGSFAVGLASAAVLRANVWGRRVFRVLLIAPWAIPVVAGCLMWVFMLDPQMGIINYVLERIGVISEPVNWLGSQDTAMLTVLMVRVWLTAPFATVTLLGALQTVPEEQLEAANIEGANTLQTFRYVTWPSILPVATTVVLLLTIWAFKDFDVIYLLTQGGPMRATTTLSVDTYLSAFHRLDIGRASAVGTMALGGSLVFSVLYVWRVVLRWEG